MMRLHRLTRIKQQKKLVINRLITPDVDFSLSLFLNKNIMRLQALTLFRVATLVSL